MNPFYDTYTRMTVNLKFLLFYWQVTRKKIGVRYFSFGLHRLGGDSVLNL